MVIWIHSKTREFLKYQLILKELDPLVLNIVQILPYLKTQKKMSKISKRRWTGAGGSVVFFFFGL
jgi:hypothetical protein